MNKFLTQAMNKAYTENGAISNASTGSVFMDQFAKAGTARGRELDDVFLDEKNLWDENPEFAVKFPFYLRMITRKSKITFDRSSETVQKGQGARDESFKRLLWLALNHPEKFYSNLWLLPVVGSWKDLWVLMTMEDTLDKEAFFKVIAEGINDDYHRDLVKKYMPQIRSNKKCKTEWATKTNQLAKEFCAFAGWSPKEYRQFKSTGKAHEFQRYICKGLYDNIKWNTIPGKALLKLVSGKFLSNHNLESSYAKWLETQPVAKFNGYPYELYHTWADKTGRLRNWYDSKINPIPEYVKHTLDKQFENLVKTAKEDNGGIKGNVWCALDTSGSMSSTINGTNGITAYDVCVSLGIYFSTLNTGAFHKNVIMFDSKSRVKQLEGTFTEMCSQVPANAMGSTNFQSVIDEIVRIRRNNPNIPLEDYPTTLLVVSDMQFNPTGGYYWNETEATVEEKNTNYQEAQRKLRAVFPKEFVDSFKTIWWYCTGRKTNDYPSTLDDAGAYYFSGFDGAVINLLLGGEEVVDEKTGKKRAPTAEEVAVKALNQEVLQLIQ